MFIEHIADQKNKSIEPNHAHAHTIQKLGGICQKTCVYQGKAYVHGLYLIEWYISVIVDEKI
jgi:hypothetical protein